MKPYSDARRARDAGYADARRAVLERAGGLCEVDGCPQRLGEIHHIRGRRIPDPHALDNLIGFCKPHHDKVHANPSWARRRGFMASRMGEVRPSRWAQEASR